MNQEQKPYTSPNISISLTESKKDFLLSPYWDAKLTEKQAIDIMSAIYPESRHNEVEERKALDQAKFYRGSYRDMYKTISETKAENQIIKNNRENGWHIKTEEKNLDYATLYMPVHCPHCQDNAWFSFFLQHMKSNPASKIAICRKCNNAYIAAKQAGHHKMNIKDLQNILHPFPLIICVLLLFATAPLPYGYYQFLRIAVTIWGLISVFKTISREQSNKVNSIALLISGAIAILYNPVLPIHLDKATWTIINLLTIPAILICTYILNNPKPTLKHRA